VRFVPPPAKTPWWQQAWLLAVLVAVGLVLVVLNVWGEDWLGLAAAVLELVVIVGLWGSFRRQRRDRSVEPPAS
jgi:hypothetical protein